MIRTGIIISIASMASGVWAAPRYIGTASCAESFWVDSAGVSHHATLFENSTVETEASPARLQITGDVRVLLDARARAQVDEKRLVLEKGRAQLDSGKDFSVEAHGIRVSLAKPGARAIVSLGDLGMVEVASLVGTVHVANAEGVAVANVAAGHSVELRVGQTSEAASLTGCVVKTGEAYTLRDEASAITVELRGTDVANDVGERVQVNGTIVPSQRALAPADQVMQAKAIQVLGGGCGAAADATMTESRARTAPQADSTGSSAATTSTVTAASQVSTGIAASTAVIAGVAVAAGAGTAAAVEAATAKHPKQPLSAGR